ncbi:MAG: metallophosphoesterase [Cyanosarcina radialis HA8281-LM2]|jgi:hypothetical protein|nr:metallophosphoesterase [Cyanosarcina radialis HA8281-LM2]
MHWLLSGRLSVEKIAIAIADLPKSLHGTKLVQMSDFHYDGLRLSEDLLLEAIAASNREQPDLVLLTGDYVTSDPKPIYPLAMRLKQLQSRFGIFAVLGNHDNCYRQSRPTVTSALASVGIEVLWNQIAYPFGSGLPLVGLADYWSREFDPAPVMSQLNAAIPCIVLSHNPDTAEILQPWRVDLQLSGHTHGGQIVLPGIGPLAQLTQPSSILRKLTPQCLWNRIPWVKTGCLEVVRHWERSQGYHQIGTNQLYVNRGLGTYRPGRLFCPPEVTVITLVGK